MSAISKYVGTVVFLKLRQPIFSVTIVTNHTSEKKSNSHIQKRF